MFTVVIQKGWTTMAENNEYDPKKKNPLHPFSVDCSTGGCRHCCHDYKITNTYQGLHSSHRHLKKHLLGRLKIQRV